jgi:hypothetical protein
MKANQPPTVLATTRPAVFAGPIGLFTATSGLAKASALAVDACPRPKQVCQSVLR